MRRSQAGEEQGAVGVVDLRAEAVVDLAAFRSNIERLRAAAPTSQLMVVVKADAYGHGAATCAREARAAGVPWLGTALPGEALALRADGDRGRLLTWLHSPGQDFAPLVAAEVDISVGARWALDGVVATGGPARVHLKVDTGLGRGGASREDWPALVAAARRAERDGVVRVVGIWSHLSCADDPTCDCTARQIAAFEEACAVARAAGLDPELRHLANSAATLLTPAAHYDLVRPGLAAYGLSPAPAVATAAGFGLRPALTLRARLSAVKHVPAGHTVSYGHATATRRPTALGLVPLGYADGVPRGAGRSAEVSVGGRRVGILGPVAMDQFVVDLTGLDASAGDEVVLFGPGADGEPTAEDWARAAGTIGYEIVTRLGSRLARRYTAESATGWSGCSG
ncbi:alanine racemase [Catenulispora yoronensis]|uniref:Alanine racemase n=1 Tax=Catenulispora yoronensis TaxID=450799 RepID=A0ABP5H408_9ACTN